MTERAIVVQGKVEPEAIPHFGSIARRAEVRRARDLAELEAALPGAEILLGWDFRADELERAWSKADALRWIHWSGAGVDAVLFRELTASNVLLTNARGIFDRAMAEYVLGCLLAMTKRLPETVELQAASRWQHRLTERIQGRRVLVVGVGSIGRAVARLLRAAGMRVCGVATSARDGDPDFEQLYATASLGEAAADAEFMVCVLPETDATRGLINEAVLDALPRGARVINVGRGSALDTAALVEKLEAGQLAGAVLDVFDEEPLPATSSLWTVPNLLVSPHMSGDYVGYDEDLGRLFARNFQRFEAGEPLLNVVNKARGY